MKHEVERFIREHGQIARVAFNRLDFQPIAFGDETVTFQLFRRIVQHGNVCACRGERWRLLSAARC